jgi:DNA-binding response OmpR family regulator
LIDWEMPGLTGPQVCGQLRAYNILRPLYLILETSRHDATDKVEGFQAGADDYLTKPFNRHEVIARVRVGLRMIQTQASLHQRVRELETALGQVRTLRQLLPICSYCRKIRNDQNYWEQLEVYLGQNSGTRFSHGICPECYNKVIHTQLREAEQFARRKEGPEPSPSI